MTLCLRVDCTCDQIVNGQFCFICRHDLKCKFHARCPEREVVFGSKVEFRISDSTNPRRMDFARQLSPLLEPLFPYLAKNFADYWIVKNGAVNLFVSQYYVGHFEDGETLNSWWQSLGPIFYNDDYDEIEGQLGVFNVGLEDYLLALSDKSPGSFDFLGRETGWNFRNNLANSYAVFDLQQPKVAPRRFPSWSDIRHDHIQMETFNSFGNSVTAGINDRSSWLLARGITDATYEWSHVQIWSYLAWIDSHANHSFPELFVDWNFDARGEITQFLEVRTSENAASEYRVEFPRLRLPPAADERVMSEIVRWSLEFVNVLSSYVREARKCESTELESATPPDFLEMLREAAEVGDAIENYAELHLIDLAEPFWEKTSEAAWWPRVSDYHWTFVRSNFDPSFGTEIESEEALHLYETSANVKRTDFEKLEPKSFIERLVSQDSKCMSPLLDSLLINGLPAARPTYMK